LWDEAVYIGMGKHLYTFGNAGLWEMIRPVGLPLLLGLFWTARLPIFLWELALIGFAVGYAILTYLIGKRLFGRESGLFAALLVIGSTTFFREAGKFLTEIPSTFFALACLYALLNRRLAYAGVCAAAAAMFKFPHLMLASMFLMYVAVEWLKSGKLRTLA